MAMPARQGKASSQVEWVKVPFVCNLVQDLSRRMFSTSFASQQEAHRTLENQPCVAGHALWGTLVLKEGLREEKKDQWL